MSLSKNNGTKRNRLLIPGNGEMRCNPMKSRITAEAERQGIGIVVETRIQEGQEGPEV